MYKIAVAAACPFPTSQGSQVFIRQFSEALLARGHDVCIVTYHFGEPGVSCRIPVWRIPAVIPYAKLRAGPSWSKPLLDLLLSVRLYQAVRRYEIQIIHAHNYEAALASTLVSFITGIPVVFHAHGVMSDELRTYFSSPILQRFADFAAGLLDPVTVRLADRTIGLCPEVVSYFIERGADTANLFAIPPGISLDDQISGQACNEPLPAVYGQGPVVFYCGNLDNYQNLGLLLDAFGRVLEQERSARLVIVTGSEPHGFAKRCTACGLRQAVHIERHAEFSRVQRLLQASAVAVLPRTAWSGFPIKLLNYMAAGCAIVACRSSAKALQHMHSGIIVADDDAEAFADGIVRLLGDEKLRRHLGGNARHRAETRYAWPRIAEEIESVYADMLPSQRI